MSKEELSAVEDFEISNEHGCIQFFGPTDLVDVDLEKDVVISQRGIDIYPDDIANPSQKPSRGQKLNKPALINLYNVPPKKGQSPKEHEKKLRQKI